MLNIKFIIDNPELVKEGLAKKGYTPEQIDIDALIALHKDVNKLKTSTQALAEEYIPDGKQENKSSEPISQQETTEEQQEYFRSGNR